VISVIGRSALILYIVFVFQFAT